MTIEARRRPVWRTYDAQWALNAAAHVRAGGHAVMRARGGPWWMVLPCDDDGMLPELSAWALLDLGVAEFSVVPSGPFEGRVSATLTPRQRRIVEAWCDRDATQGESTVEVALDCMACAMCCRHNRVELEEPDDLARWTAAGRDDLAGSAFVRRRGGRRYLRLAPSGDCVHLVGNACGVYALRPNNCRAFPMGSEGCLSARAEAGLDPA